MQDSGRVARAEELRTQFIRGYVGIARRIWPWLDHVTMLTSGCFANYANTLRDMHMRSVRQCSMLHAASEAFVGVVSRDCTWCEPPRYSLCTPLVYLEFLAVDDRTMTEKVEVEEYKLFYPEEVGKHGTSMHCTRSDWLPTRRLC